MHRILQNGRCECCGLTRSELKNMAKSDREKLRKKELDKALKK